jgi:hypothetical protein
MNSWIFQANPQVFMIDWFLDEYAMKNPNDKDWWIIHKKHQKYITPFEDEVYIWKAASEPSKTNFNEYFQWMESIGRKGMGCTSLVGQKWLGGFGRLFLVPAY